MVSKLLEFKLVWFNDSGFLLIKYKFVLSNNQAQDDQIPAEETNESVTVAVEEEVDFRDEIA